MSAYLIKECERNYGGNISLVVICIYFCVTCNPDLPVFLTARVKDVRSGAEGIENPAFNISTRNLSAYHDSAEKEIRHDRHDSTLAAHQQKLLLRTNDQARGEVSVLINLKVTDM